MTNPKWEWAGWRRKPSKYESRGYELLISNYIKTFTFTGKRLSFRVGWRKVYNYARRHLCYKCAVDFRETYSLDYDAIVKINKALKLHDELVKKGRENDQPR